MRVALGAARQGCQVAARMRRVLRWDPRRQRRRIRTIIVMQQLPMALTLAKPRRCSHTVFGDAYSTWWSRRATSAVEPEIEG